MNHTQEPSYSLPQVRSHIIEVALNLFRKQGVRNVTMDDIAHRLGMSKRTLYQIFRDKEDLVLACVQQHDAKAEAEASRLFDKADNVLSFIMAFMQLRIQEIDQMQPSFFADILKYQKVKVYFEQRNRKQEATAVEMLDKGKEEGFFRGDVNFHIVYNNLVGSFETLLHSPGMEHISHREIFFNTAILYIRGCTTPKGMEIVDRFMPDIGNHAS